jgi:D-3-phosphoglycerate dehydrogenase
VCIAILDDFEKIAHTVPTFDKLKARADISLLRERLDTSEKIVQTLRPFDIIVLMRERTSFTGNEYRQLPNLRFISQTGRTSVHLDLPSASR